MSLSPNEKYPGATEADPNYKDSKFKDNNPSTTNNGSPLKALDRNEQLALQEAMMNAAGFDYNGVVDTPQNSQMFNAYKAALSNGANLLSNHNFLTQTPDDSLPKPGATAQSYPPGYQIFSNVFANETSGISNLTYIDGHVSFSGGDFYMPRANSKEIENITEFVASVADFDGKPRTRGVSYALVGDEYRVTVGVDALEDESANETLLGSVKFEQGTVATGHEVRSINTEDLAIFTSPIVGYKTYGSYNSPVKDGSFVSEGYDACYFEISGNVLILFPWDDPSFSDSNHTVLSVNKNSNSGYDVVTDVGSYEFVTEITRNYRLDCRVIGWSDNLMGVGDLTSAWQMSVNYAISSGCAEVIVDFPYNKISDTITVNSSWSLSFRGKGERVTEVEFINSTVDKVMFELTPSSSNTVFYDMYIHDGTPGTSTFMRFSANLPNTTGYSHYKDGTQKCRIADFKTAVLATAEDPTDGATHAFCSEAIFYHTRFKNNRTTIRMENIQAVDFTMIGSDIENDDPGESYTFISDVVGGEYKIYGGSFVGKGVFYDCEQPAGSSNLWQASKLLVNGSRFEVRGGHTGVMFKPIAQSNATNALIQLKDCLFLMFGQTLSLVDFGGKTNIQVDGCRVVAGKLTINLFPTAGITGFFDSADGFYKSFGSIRVICSEGFEYIKQESSPYGVYDSRYTCPITIENSQSDPNGSYDIDSEGFMSFISTDYQQRAVGIGNMKEFALIYNVDRPQTSFSDVKMNMPFGSTPSKLTYFKHPNVRSSNVEVNAYVVKDSSDWAGSSFNPLTDTIPIATTGDTSGKAGYMEFPIELTDSYFDAGSYFQAGLGNWNEGRVFIQEGALSATGGAIYGFVGFKYV